MLVNTKNEKICINQLVCKGCKDIEIESDVIIPDVKPDILNVVNSSGIFCLQKKEVLDGRVKIDGSINLFVMYISTDENSRVRGLNTSVDFSKYIDVPEAREGMSISEKVCIKSIECSILNERKINIKICLKFEYKICTNEEIEVITEVCNCNGMQFLNDKVEVCSILSCGTANVFAKENINIQEEENAVEILKACVNFINKDIKISYNKILAKAELDVHVMYLTENNCIGNAEARIPVMGFIDVQNVSEENICDIKYLIKSIIIKPNNSETKGIYVEAPIELTCCTYEKKCVNVIQDLYMPGRKTSYDKRSVNAVSSDNKFSQRIELSERVQLPEIIGHRLLDVNVSPTISKKNILNDKVVYEGDVRLDFTFDNETNIVGQKRFEIPFNFSKELNGINPASDVEVTVEVEKQDFIIGENGSIDCNIELMSDGERLENKNLNIISNINNEEAENTNNCSIIVYFVKKNDSVWQIAKKFGSTVEDIVKLNDIQNPEQLKIGQQLFIPKFTGNKVA